MPDLNSLKSISDALNITINELISGQCLSEGEYSQKAEETIMSLMKENENNKSKNYVISVVGVVLICLAMLLLLLNTRDEVNGLALFRYIDIVSFLLVIFPAIGIVLISRKRNMIDILCLLDKVIVPIGVICALSNFVMMTSSMSDLSTIGPNLSVCVLGLLYAVLAKIAVVILITLKEMK